ncbi:MAG: arsenate reductase (azurin) small subunit, partial [Ancalomicrobiaceae bacterium]|nr:arsenate reductase (azurin) small subunit [Ancalomicrobiaceae bacterium]
MKTCDGLVEAGRRQFLRSAGFSVAGVAAATVMPTPAKAATATARVAYPSNRLANLKDLKVNDPVNIAYPDNDSPGILLKLGVKVDGGVGPDGDVVAYSVLCPHK